MPTNKASKIIGKEDLVHLVAGKANVSLRETQSVMDAFLSTVEEQVAKGHQVRLIGFGSWQKRPVKARIVKSIRTGAPVHIPAGERVTFTTGSLLAQAAKGRVPTKKATATTAGTPKKR